MRSPSRAGGVAIRCPKARGLALALALSSCLLLACNRRGGEGQQAGPRARIAQADALLRQNKPRDAVQVLERALSGGADPALSTRAGMVYAQLGDWKRAREHLERAQRGKPDVALASLLALARACSGDLAGARALVPKHDDARKGTELGVLVGAALASSAEDMLPLRTRLLAWRDKHADPPAELLAGLGAIAASMRDANAAREAFARVREARLADPAWAVGLALVHQRRDRPDAAEALLRRLVALHPEHREGWTRLADVALSTGDAATARAALAHLPARGETPLWLRTLRARAAMLAEDPKGACDVLGGALASAAGKGEAAAERDAARLLHARCLAQTGKAADAERELIALASAPQSAVQAELQLAEVLLARDRAADAVARLMELLRAHPEAAWAYYWLGRAREAQKDWTQAAFAYGTYLDRARGDRPQQRAEVLYRLAFVNKAQGNSAQAERLLEAALTAHPEAIDALRALAAMKPADQALARVRAQIAASVQPAPARLLLAELLREHGQAAEAERVHRELIELEPHEVRGYTALANFYVKQDRRAQAIEVLERARALQPQHRVVLALLAATYGDAGQPARAAEIYEALLVQTPGSVPALNNLAVLYADALGRLDQALVHARKARALAPAWPEVADTLGWVLAKRGAHAEALPLLEQAAQAMPDNPSVLYHLGAAQIGAGQRAPGRSTLQRALRARKPFPESEQAAQLLAAK